MRRLIPAIILIVSAMLLTSRAQQLTLPDKPNPVRFAAIGDMGTGDKAQYEVAQEMLAYHQKFPFDFVIMLGDNIYGGHSPGDFEQKFSVPYKPLLDAGVKFYASLGNHDDPNERFYKPFNMNGTRYYTFKKGNVRFFVLDSNYMDPPQLQWLENELQKSSGSEWKICYFHHPLYSSGKTHGSSLELRALLEPLFIKYGVNAVFEGHDHVYERVKPQNGIYYFTEGAAGQLRYGDLKITGMTEVGFDKDQSFMLVEVAGTELYFQTVTRTGSTIDSGMIVRKPGVQSAISEPGKIGVPAPATNAPTPPAIVSSVTAAPVQPTGSQSPAPLQSTKTTAGPGPVPAGNSGQSANSQAVAPVPAKIIPPEPPIQAPPKPQTRRQKKKMTTQSQKVSHKKSESNKPVAASSPPG